MNNNDSQHMYDQCKEHMHSYVLVEAVDGSQFDGIITGLDEENVYLAVPMGSGEQMGMSSADASRQFAGYYGHGYPGYGYGYPSYGHQGYGYGRPRRFNRLVLPLAALAALSILPWY